MKNIIQIVLSKKEVEEAVREYIDSFIPESANVSVRCDGKWEEFPTYQRETDCIKIEFDRKDVEKELEEMSKKTDDGQEMPWDAPEPSESDFL